jgi:hypothetical protein
MAHITDALYPVPASAAPACAPQRVPLTSISTPLSTTPDTNTAERTDDGDFDTVSLRQSLLGPVIIPIGTEDWIFSPLRRRCQTSSLTSAKIRFERVKHLQCLMSMCRILYRLRPIYSISLQASRPNLICISCHDRRYREKLMRLRCS